MKNKQQRCDLRGNKPFLAQANHGWNDRSTGRNERVKIRVQGNHNPVF